MINRLNNPAIQVISFGQTDSEQPPQAQLFGREVGLGLVNEFDSLVGLSR